MKKNTGFRAWFYFRQGWTTYFAFIFAALNTMVVTYYLAIENIPVLKTVFPSFYAYLVVTAALGIPLLIFVGYAHQKKTASYKTEADIYYESNPHALRSLINTEILLELNLKLNEKLIKIISDDKLSEEEIEDLRKLQKEIIEFTGKRTLKNKMDLTYFKKMYSGK
jgi:hypothetical protein